ncbi:phasin PhaH [Caulobacter sp.]|uniref:phasin PhaH n=1 Tax=Caulobacter sp. TaxID=78 RepID=UPI002B45EB27|nr:phasin PhaH [Caulobacter sp.]HJV40499.1 phasin PhaH [Caulobacter sp.]
MVSSSSFLPEFQADKIAPETAPRVVVGAVSPLWLMFGGAAAAGAAYWWWASRWREAVNLEAVLALAPEPVAPALEAEAELEAAPEPVVEMVAAAVEAAETMLDATKEVTEAVAEAEVAVVASVSEASVEAVEAVTETASEVVEPAAKVTEATVDDLTRLVGVGPKLAASLAELGVTRFSQIAAWTPDELATVDEQLNLKGRAERDAWIAQAKRFAAGVEAD